MAKSKKGLSDPGDGEFILNESGTSVSTDKTEEGSEINDDEQSASQQKALEEKDDV